MKKRVSLVLLVLAMLFVFTGCNSNGKDQGEKEPVTITVAIAAGLKNVMENEIITAFKKEYPEVEVLATYDSSGKLQSQIEAGASVDVFMSAAIKQMNSLNDKNLLLEDSVVNLMENKIVLIVPFKSNKDINSFTDITKADNIGIGDPASVPVGQYAKEALSNLGIWDQISKKASLGTTVTQVLNWVAEGSAEAGIVYATDAISNKSVKVVEEAPEGSVSKVIYPVGIIKSTANEETAKKFIKFLQTKEILDIFESYGFLKVK